jgi:hypothetical protein
MENDTNGDSKSSNREIVKIDKRLDNIEKAIITIENIASDGLEKWAENKKQQLEFEKKKDEINNQQHSRNIKLISFAISIIFILCVIALYLRQYELVKWILSSSFAIGTGAGITNLIKKK